MTVRRSKKPPTASAARMGGRLGRRAPVVAHRRDRRDHARSRSRARRDDGRDVRGRQRAPNQHFAARPRHTIAASIANEFAEAVGDLYTSSLMALGLILFVITFVVIAGARLLLMRLESGGNRKDA